MPRRGADENTNVVSPSCRDEFDADESDVPSPHPPVTSVTTPTTSARFIPAPNARNTILHDGAAFINLSTNELVVRNRVASPDAEPARLESELDSDRGVGEGCSNR